MARTSRQRVEIEAAIRATGRRVTAQRVMILEALQAMPGHQSVEAIHDWVRRRRPRSEMALSTIYRTLDALTEIGLVTAFDDGEGRARYEWARGEEPHHHLVCDRCGHRAEVELKAMADVLREVEEGHGFVADIRHLAIRGACAACRASKESR